MYSNTYIVFQCGVKGHYANKCPRGDMAFLQQTSWLLSSHLFIIVFIFCILCLCEELKCFIAYDSSLVMKWFFLAHLKMLGLYFYTLIISHKVCKMLSILKKLTLQKKLKIFVTNNVFFGPNGKNTLTEQKSNIENPG